jgi:hypothetical protein
MNANFGIIYRANVLPKEVVENNAIKGITDFIKQLNE